MAYTSRAWVSQWSYDPSGNDFNAKVGTILAGPAGQIKATVPPTVQPLTLEAQKPARSMPAPPGSAESHSQHVTTSAGPPPGYVWVDTTGNVLASTACIGSPDRTKLPEMTQHDGLHDKARTMASLQPAERSMLLWKTVSPGMMPGTSQTPVSTNQDTYTADPEALSHVHWEHHLKKTDFSAYLEAAARDMKHIATGHKK